MNHHLKRWRNGPLLRRIALVLSIVSLLLLTKTTYAFSTVVSHPRYYQHQRVITHDTKTRRTLIRRSATNNKNDSQSNILQQALVPDSSKARKDDDSSSFTTSDSITSTSENATTASLFGFPLDSVGKTLILLLLSQFLLFIGVGAVIPSIPLYGKEIGLSSARRVWSLPHPP